MFIPGSVDSACVGTASGRLRTASRGCLDGRDLDAATAFPQGALQREVDGRLLEVDRGDGVWDVAGPDSEAHRHPRKNNQYSRRQERERFLHTALPSRGVRPERQAPTA